MRDVEIYERRAREAEDLANLVSLPQNRRRYLAIAHVWRELLAAARPVDVPQQVRAA
ncbi:MAG: hypothetical protein JWQ97_3463 [Phenylobacterium sp.]|nr:hypothetical protein [Phenylobacterium sp.]